MEKTSFLMIDFEMPEFIKDLQKYIPEEELYKPENPENGFEYGLETESHVTLAPCLDNDINLVDLKKLLKPIDEYKAKILDISVFENQDFDVLKCNVFSNEMVETNTLIFSKYECYSEYKDYHPHMTIAYMKKGMARKYIKYVMDELVVLEPVNFAFGYFDKNDNYVRKTWK